MEELLGLLFFLVVLVVVPILTAILFYVAAKTMLHRRNRVSPTTRSDAPISWMGAPTAGARLHRRLRTAVQVARRSADFAPVAPHLGDLVTDLEREAVTLDTHIVIASGMSGRQGRERMRALAGQVLRVEQLASQISLLAAQAQAPLVAAGHASALDDLSRQLDLLEQARDEVARVETAAGVTRVSPYADPTRVPASPPLEKRRPGRAQPG